MSKAFIAYPAGLPTVSESIKNTISGCRERRNPLELVSWEQMDIPGRFIIEEVLSSIDNAEILIADISRLNFNVTYEIGYAIGRKKRILLIKNRAIRQESPRLDDLGIFDTIGYKEYSSSTDLIGYLQDVTDLRAIPYSEHRNPKAPLYLLETKHKTDFDNTIVSRIKKSRFYFRSFDPAEIPRLSAAEAISQVAESYGVVVHFISPELIDAPLNNLRAAFIAGLTDGMERKGLFIQSGEGPVPIDYRDFVSYCRYPDQFKDVIAEFAETVTEELQEVLPIASHNNETLLQTLDLGASSAENEITSLAEYYVEIDAFNRALRKEVRLVTGRKGSGKTAIFYRLRDTVRANRANVVLDLKPEGYQLLKFKNAVVNLMSSGTVEHTITAFWEYLLWLEICYKLIEKDRELHKRDHHLFELYQRLLAAYKTDVYSSEGDFAERLRVLLRDIKSEIDARFGGQTNIELSRPQITELVYRHDFSRLKSLIEEYLEHKGEVWLLFDNIDKGWPSQGVTKEDLIIVRALLEATRKIERELQKKSLDAHTVIFLRNDVYEILVDSTSDRGKETRVNVDWADPDLLREMIRRRIVRNFPEAHDAGFEEIWRKICDPIIDGEESSQYLIDRCLMRPRSLIELLGHCRGYAVNLGHERILKEDVLPPKGLGAFSNDLVTELGLEIRDVFIEAEDVLYAFIGAPSKMDRQCLVKILAEASFTQGKAEAVIDILFWFGFLGFVWTDGEARFIYSFNYNMQVLRGSHRKLIDTGITYLINPAFIPALGVQESTSTLI